MKAPTSYTHNYLISCVQPVIPIDCVEVDDSKYALNILWSSYFEDTFTRLDIESSISVNGKLGCRKIVEIYRAGRRKLPLGAVIYQSHPTIFDLRKKP